MDKQPINLFPRIGSQPISRVYNMDCMDAMKQMPDNYFQLSLVDPPYGINAEQGTNRASRKQFKNKAYGWDSAIPEAGYFTELKRVSVNQIIWGGNYFLAHLGNTRGFIIWDKLNPDRCFADCEFAWSSLDVVARIYKTERVQELNAKDGGKIHPTQKPVQLYKWLLKNYAKEGDKILDTHLGSGSSRIACWDGGFDFWGFELDADYFKAAEQRFQIHISQQRLF
jgi:site-specific DNA-methyltransferase (adenine-specific)